jgi:hypothetical protein
MAIYLGTTQLDGGGGSGGGGTLINQYASFIIQDGNQPNIPATNGYNKSTGIYTTSSGTFLRTGELISESSAVFSDYPDATITNHDRSVVAAVSQSRQPMKFWVIGNSMYVISGVEGNKEPSVSLGNYYDGYIDRYDFDSTTNKFSSTPDARTLIALGSNRSSTNGNELFPVTPGIGQYYTVKWFHYNEYSSRFYICLHRGNNASEGGYIYFLSVRPADLIDNSSAIATAIANTNYINAYNALKSIMVSNRNAGMWDNAFGSTNTSGSYDIGTGAAYNSTFQNYRSYYPAPGFAYGVGVGSDGKFHWVDGETSFRIILEGPVPNITTGHLGSRGNISKINSQSSRWDRRYDWSDNVLKSYITETNPDGTIDLKLRTLTYTGTDTSSLVSDVKTTVAANLGGTSNILTPYLWGKESNIFGVNEHLWLSSAATVNRTTFEIQAHIGDPTIRKVTDSNLTPSLSSDDDSYLLLQNGSITVSGTTDPNRNIIIASAVSGFGANDTLTLEESDGTIYKGIITNVSGTNPVTIAVDFTGEPDGIPDASTDAATYPVVKITDRVGEFKALLPTVFLRIK